MIFRLTGLPGAYLIEPERHEDERGFFARTFDREAFAERALATEFPQVSISYNRKRGTLRGLHYQAAPHEECKLVRCTQGSLVDVLVDLRPDSPTFKKHVQIELTAINRLQVYIPPGVAHGFQTLESSTEVLYLISAPYVPESARGHRFDDPTLAISWPEPVTVISERDLGLPLFSEEAAP